MKKKKVVIYAGAGLEALGCTWIKTKLGKNKKKSELKVLGTFRYPKEIKESVVIALAMYDCIKVDDKLVYYREYKPEGHSDTVEKDLVAEDLVINLKEGLIDKIHSLVIEVKNNKYQVILTGYKNGKVKLVEGILKKEKG